MEEIEQLFPHCVCVFVYIAVGAATATTAVAREKLHAQRNEEQNTLLKPVWQADIQSSIDRRRSIYAAMISVCNWNSSRFIHISNILYYLYVYCD